ncbi:MAG: VOC family protein, partial [Planctomycetota bacterium]
MTATDPDLRLRRIAIAVRNLDRAKELFETLFAGTFEPPAVATGEEVRCLELRRGGGQPVVELVMAMSDEGAVARFIRKKGEGIHHLSFEVPDLTAALARLAEAGGRVVRTPSY